MSLERTNSSIVSADVIDNDNEDAVFASQNPEDGTGESNDHEVQQPPAKKSRTQRKPSSTIPGMTTGDIRKCMNQIRRGNLVQQVRPEHLLFNGMSAGTFCLAYVLGHDKRNRKHTAPSGTNNVAAAERENTEGEGVVAASAE